VRVDAAELQDFLHGSVEVTPAMREFFAHLRRRADPVLVRKQETRALAAMLDRKCVALFAFGTRERGDAVCLVARGTYVRREFRRCGLAHMLWQRVLIEYAECEHVSATVTSRGGLRLVESLACRHSDVVFRINDLSTRLVRVLRAA